jgi:hypothetical protein
MKKPYYENPSLEDDDLCCSNCEQFVESEDELTECESCGYFKVCPDCRDEALDDENLCPNCQEDLEDLDEEDDI